MNGNFDIYITPYAIENITRNTLVKLLNSQNGVSWRYDVINDIKLAVFGLFSLKIPYLSSFDQINGTFDTYTIPDHIGNIIQGT